MDVRKTAIDGVLVVTPRRFGDDRGWFMETWNREKLTSAGAPDVEWVQDNHSYSAKRGVVRGLHYQRPPNAQDKLVRCVRGRVLDVAVDIRAGSPTFGEHVALELTAEGGEQLLVPRGFAHGFCTLEPDCEVLYKVSGRYSPADDRGIRWDDAELGVAWPVDPRDAVLSEKDAALPAFADAERCFIYDG